MLKQVLTTPGVKQVGELVLIDPENPDKERLIVCSDLSTNKKGEHTFKVQQNWFGGKVYKVTIKVTEDFGKQTPTPPPETPVVTPDMLRQN